jgi:hypothetical protein
MRTLIVCLSLIAMLAVPAVANASESQFTMFEAPRELLSDDAALRSQTLDEIQGFGVHWVRIVLYWNSVAPANDSATMPSFDETDPTAYPGFERYDRAIGEARARGMRILLTVSGPVPRWATAGARDHVTRPSPARFQRFMTAVVRRYDRDVDYWAIWNEPNHPDFLQPQYTGSGSKRHPESGAIYRRLVQAADRGMRAAGASGDRMLIGETAPRGTTRVVAPLTFVRQALCLDARYHRRKGCSKLPADGYAHHAYTTAAGPFFVPPSRNDVTVGVLGRLNHALAAAGATGAIRRDMGIYLTEFGIQSRPDPYVGVSFTQQAEYRSISERIAYSNGRVRAFSQYLMRDDLPREGPASGRYGGFESGLRTSGGAPKSAYEGFRLPMVARRGSRSTSLWGLVRPAGGRTAVSIDYRPAGSSTWRLLKRDTTNARGYWSTATRLVQGRSYRVRWIAPAGAKSVAGPRTRTYRGA